jgi:hypothetical protein
MTQKYPIAPSVAHQTDNDQILTSNVYFSKNMREQNFASSSAIPSESSVSEQCRESQLAEGTCFEKAIATSSLEAVAVEEILATPLTRSHPQMQNVTDPSLIALCFLGIVSIGSVSLVSIIALVFGRDISLAAVLDPMGSMKLKTTGKAKDAEEK